MNSFDKLDHLDIEYLAFVNNDMVKWADPEHAARPLVPLHTILPAQIKTLIIRRCFGDIRWDLFSLLDPTLHPTIPCPQLKSIHVEMWPAYTEELWTGLKQKFERHAMRLTVSRYLINPTKDSTSAYLRYCSYEDDCTIEDIWTYGWNSNDEEEQSDDEEEQSGVEEEEMPT